MNRAPILICVLLFCSWSAVANAQTVLGIGPGFFVEDSDLSAEEQASIELRDESFAYTSDGFLSGSIYIMKDWTESIRLGGQVTYYGTYSASVTPEGDNNNDEEPQIYEFGRLLEVSARIEYLLPVTDTIDLALGGMAGFPILIPDGDFQAEIDRLKDQEVGVFDLPRIGYLLSPVFGARYKYSEHLYFRGDLLFKWEQLFLFRTTEEVQSIPFRKTWSTSTLRSEFTLGIEVVL